MCVIFILNMSRSATKILIWFFKHNKGELLDVFNAISAPLSLPSKRELKLLWIKNEKFVRLTTTLVMLLLPRRFRRDTKRNLSKFVRKLCYDQKYVYAMKSVNYIVRSMVIPFSTTEHHLLFKICSLIIDRMKPTMLFSKRPKVTPFKLLFSLRGDRVKTLNMPSFERHSFVHKFLTPNKRLSGGLQNAIITNLWERAENKEEMSLVVNPSNNYVKRLAYLEELRHNMTLLGLSDSMLLLQDMADYLTGGKMKYDLDDRRGQPCPMMDVDLLTAFMSMNAATRSKFFSKTLEVSYPECTCFTKCMGAIAQHPVLVKQFENEFCLNNFSTRICGECRLSHVIDNTTSGKPRKSLSACNPGMSSCSMDACTVTLILRYLIHERVDERHGNLIKYGHRFYITNSSAVTDTVYRGNNITCSSATGRTGGVCFGGSRTCYKLIQNLVKSSKQYGLPRPFADRNCWWSCHTCQGKYGTHANPRNSNQYNRDRHGFFSEEIHRNTCVDTFYQNVLRKVRKDMVDKDKEEEDEVIEVAVKHCYPKICRWCKSAIMCRHTMDGLVNMLVTSPKSRVLLNKVVILSLLQKLIKIEWT